jgi:SET domain-containing protein
MRIEFRASKIHGTGGFATTPIPAGARVLEYVGKKIDSAECLRQCEANNPFVFALGPGLYLDGNAEGNPARMLNHSCDPNCDAELVGERIWIVARRAIAVGEEITFNYGYDLESYREYPCQCGSARCVGYILGEEFHGKAPVQS